MDDCIIWMGLCVAASYYVVNIAPDSTVLVIIGLIITWIVGIDLGCCAGIGALFGAGLTWAVIDIFGALQHHAP